MSLLEKQVSKTLRFFPPKSSFLKSPNFSTRGTSKVSKIIVHATTSDKADSTIHWFMSPESQRSAHYMVTREGLIYQFVEEQYKAWHSKGCNHYSIGIEFCSSGGPMTTAQEMSGVALIFWLLQKYKLGYEDILRHKDANPNHATECPAGLFGDRSLETFEKWRTKHFSEHFIA